MSLFEWRRNEDKRKMRPYDSWKLKSVSQNYEMKSYRVTQTVNDRHVTRYRVSISNTDFGLFEVIRPYHVVRGI